MMALDDLFLEAEKHPDYIAEGVALRIMEEACELMEEQGITRSELAARMGVSRARINQIMGAPPSLTLRQVAQLAIALGTEPHACLLPTRRR